MESKRIKLNLVGLPADVELTLYLIREGLKARRLLGALDNLGVDTSQFDFDNVEVVLAYMGFAESDDTYNWYNNLLSEYAQVPKANRGEVAEEAFAIYAELLVEKRKRMDL